MMKRLWIISFAIFYCLFNTGAVVRFHFCQGDFDHLTINGQPADCCDGGCCSNSAYELKVHTDYETTDVLSVNMAHSAFVANHNPGVIVEQVFIDGPLVPEIDTRPLINLDKSPIYLSNRVLLI